MKAIVITSINQPTEAVIKFAKLSDCQLFVVGDKKSPQDWHHEGVKYLGVEDQAAMDCALYSALPWNHYARKMLGYLAAIKMGATTILDTDDDNIPKVDFGFPSFDAEYETFESATKFINTYQLFTDQKIWPRGLPLSEVNAATPIQSKVADGPIGVWQGLADEDPDVDAIYRISIGEMCYFNERAPIAVKRGIFSPFNSQNTLVRAELFALLYLPTSVTFRFTDILRSYVALPIMWAHGYSLGFTGASVLQKRNPHDLFQDFLSELPMYTGVYDVIQVVQEVVSPELSIEENLLAAYRKLLEINVVKESELATLEAWIKDLKAL